MHETLEHSFSATGQFAYHSWESLAMPYLEALTPAKVRLAQNSFTRMCRDFMAPSQIDDVAFAEYERQRKLEGGK